MSGSFFNHGSRVDSIIRASQAEWRRGYDLGKQGDASLQESIEQRSRSFQDGYYRGWEEFFKMAAPITPPAPKGVGKEEMAKEQYERGRHMGRNELDVSATVLAQCHPEFRKGYWQGVADSEPIIDHD